MEGWTKAANESQNPMNFDWDAYAKPGDLVDEGVYENFLDALPPRSLSFGYLQMGEPHSSRLNPKTGKYEMTYLTFVRYLSVLRPLFCRPDRTYRIGGEQDESGLYYLLYSERERVCGI